MCVILSHYIPELYGSSVENEFTDITFLKKEKRVKMTFMFKCTPKVFCAGIEVQSWLFFMEIERMLQLQQQMYQFERYQLKSL